MHDFVVNDPSSDHYSLIGFGSNLTQSAIRAYFVNWTITINWTSLKLLNFVGMVYKHTNCNV